ncbi:9292_t:CDS:2, partial [Diversispora eburnea]
MVKNTTCDRCGLNLSTYQKYQQHLNQKNPCQPKNFTQVPIGNLATAPVLVQNITPTEENVSTVDPGIRSSLANKTILIYKNIPNEFEFYDGKKNSM